MSAASMTFAVLCFVSSSSQLVCGEGTWICALGWDGHLLAGLGTGSPGPWSEGLAQLAQGLNTWRATGAQLGVPYLMCLQAETHYALGQLDAARSCVSEAQALADRHDKRWWEAECYRLGGEILLAQKDSRQTLEDAETCFQRALGMARQQQAKSLEL